MSDWTGQFVSSQGDGDTFVASRPTASNGRLFGGLVAAQALAAAGATVAVDKLPQSLHAYFLRGGEPGVDVELSVERTRIGRSFDVRTVTATQSGAVILKMMASFHSEEPAADWQPSAPVAIPLKESIPARMTGELGSSFEIRVSADSGGRFAGLPFWLKARGPIPDDPLTRACALTFISDLGLMAAARVPGSPPITDRTSGASLDHALWFHRPYRPEKWHYYHSMPLNGNDSRGLATGSLYDAQGALIATVTQEALWRY